MAFAFKSNANLDLVDVDLDSQGPDCEAESCVLLFNLSI